MIRDLEEAIEDALVGYLGMKMPGNIKCYPALSSRTLEYPALIVEAGVESDNLDDDSLFDGHRRVGTRLLLVVEAADGSTGDTAVTPREVNRALRRALWEAISEESLHSLVNAVEYPGVLFSQITPGPGARGTDGTQMVTEVTLQVIAQSTE